MIPTMNGVARPEHIATTDWLAEQLNRPGVRVIDARWRPDGTSRTVYASGHIPGAVHVDWRTDLIDTGEDSDALFLAGPDRVAALAARIGVGDGSTVVIYDDSQGLFASRTWWSLRAYGLETVRILDGGYGAWTGDGRPISNAEVHPPPTPFTIRGPNRMRLTTADVRGLLGSPDVTLIDARAAAEYRGFEGNTRRLGHIPGAVNVPGRGHERARQPSAAPRGTLCASCSRRERHTRSADGLLRRVGRRRGEARLCADPDRLRGRRGLRRRLGRVGRPPRPPGRPLGRDRLAHRSGARRHEVFGALLETLVQARSPSRPCRSRRVTCRVAVRRCAGSAG